MSQENLFDDSLGTLKLAEVLAFVQIGLAADDAKALDIAKTFLARQKAFAKATPSYNWRKHRLRFVRRLISARPGLRPKFLLPEDKDKIVQMRAEDARALRELVRAFVEEMLRGELLALDRVAEDGALLLKITVRDASVKPDSTHRDHMLHIASAMLGARGHHVPTLRVQFFGNHNPAPLH